MNKLIVLSFLILCCCSNNSDNTIILSDKLKKVTIREVETFDRPGRVMVYDLQYDTDLKITNLTINEEGYNGSLFETYQIEYNNAGEITRAVKDCYKSYCGVDFARYYEITFEYLQVNGDNIIAINLNAIYENQDIVNRLTGVKYSINSDNYITKQDSTIIFYKNQNLIGFSSTQGLDNDMEYLDFDDKSSVIIYSDGNGVIKHNEFIYRLILGLKYSKNNYRRRRFSNFEEYITLEFDKNNRPVNRKTGGMEQIGYEETFEYID